MNEAHEMKAAEHARMRARILAVRAGLLSEPESNIVRSHVEGCASCRVLERELASEPGGSWQHIPMELIAAWPRASRTLRGLERRMVARHISRCEECRQRLEVLGYTPELEPIAPTGVLPMRPRRHDPVRWALGGWAAAASVVALLLVLQPRVLRIAAPERPQGLPVSRAGAPPVPSAVAIHVLDLPPAAELTAKERSPGQQVVFATTDVTGHVVCLLLPAQALRSGEVASVEMHLLGPGGAVLWSQIESADRFTRARRLSLDLGASVWRPGSYTLRLTIKPGPAALVREPEVRELPFEVRPQIR